MTGRALKICCVLLAGTLMTFHAGELSAQVPGAQGVSRGRTQQPGQTGTGQRQTGLAGQRQQAVEDDENVPFFGEGTEVDPAADTVKKKRPKRPLESYFFPDSVRARLNMVWTADPYANHIRISHIDTLQADFQNVYPFMKKGVGSAYLGNLGAPTQYLSFFDRTDRNYPSFAEPWDAYLITPATTNFYNVKKPFTQLSYMMAGQKQNQEEDLYVIHAQNISPQTGFNINYRSLGTKGIYSWQATRDKQFSMAVNHTGKRYTVHAAYIWNSIYNRENGGMVDDDDIILDLNEWEMTENIPMSMSDPKNRIRSNTFFLTQSFGVPLRKVREEDFTIADRPAVFIGHTMSYESWSRRYEDTYAGTIYSHPPKEGEPPKGQERYYDDWWFSYAGSRDSISESRFANRIFVQFQPWDRGGVIGTIDGGVGADIRRRYQFVPDQYNTGVGNSVGIETEYYAYAGINGNIKRYFDWEARFKIHPFGAAQGDIEAGGKVAARVFVKGRPLSVSGSFSFSSLRPDYWKQSFYSNHFIWHNFFSKENETRFDVSLSVPHIGFTATASQSILGDRIYFNEYGRPTQTSEVVSVTGVYLREDLPIRIGSSSVNLNHRVMLQWSTNQKIVPVPLAAAYLSYSYEFNVVKNVLRLQVGVDGRYNTRYYAPGWNPGTGQFYNQREKQLGDYIWMDVFVNAKWKRMRILLKLEHLNYDMFGTRNYFTVLHYPTNARVFKIGISWNFYD